ncbi:MAG: tetratricopeptide repeat protein [Acidimicrobiales bacterium]
MTPPAVTPAPAMEPDEIAALEEERDFLLQSLRDLDQERDASDIDDGDYRTLHDDYTARAAAVLRTLEAAHEPLPQPPATGPSSRRAARTAPVPAAKSRTSRARRTIIGVTIVLLLAVAAGVSLTTFTGNRIGGDNVSGRGTSETARHVAKAQQLEGQGKAAEALKEYDAAIEADASNVVALTYKGWLLGRAGFNDPAMASLDKAIATNPAYPDAHFFRGMVLYKGRQDPAAAVPEFEAYLASNPPASAAAAVRDVLDKARAAAAAPAPRAPAPPAPSPSAPAPPAPG